LDLTVVGHPDIAPSGVPQRIDPEGRLVLPYCGPIVLAGLSTSEARARIETQLGEYLQEPQVGLSVRAFAARQAYVLGEVTKPGGYVPDRPLTAMQVLALAGGVRTGGDRESVALMRARDGELEVHFFDAATPDMQGLIRVEPDDVVFVRQSRGGAFSEQVVPVLQAAAPIFSALTNLVVVTAALDNNNN
jgi:polysaccharide export outer membrane protein